MSYASASSSLRGHTRGTHLGDEYVILAQRDPRFERINVSHEDWEYGVSLEGSQWTVRHGGIRPIKSSGYYSDHLLGSDVATLTPSRHNYEPTFGFEYTFGGLTWNHRQLYVSADARDKLVYNYHQTAQTPEERQWSLNLHIGAVEEKNMPQIDRTPLKQIFVQVDRGAEPVRPVALTERLLVGGRRLGLWSIGERTWQTPTIPDESS